MNVHADWQFDSRFGDEFYRGVIVCNATGKATCRTEQAYTSTTEAVKAADALIAELVSA